MEKNKMTHQNQSCGRRDFLKLAGAASGGILAATGSSAHALGRHPGKTPVPSYLSDYSDLYQIDPHGAALEWFKDARFGLFLHYGLYSILGRGEWVMLRERIPLAEYEKLKDEFNAKRFDADFITDLACEAEMKYVNITTRHHDSFCLFDTEYTSYNSVNSPAKRDLIKELAVQCQKKKLGLFLYYSYALDWRHPWFFTNESFVRARPNYREPEPRYLYRKDEDFAHYIDFVHGQLHELLTQYGPVAGVWFDPILPYYARYDLFPIEETYSMMRTLQPQTLISFKQGATGTEDFAAPEREGRSLADRVLRLFECEKRYKMAAAAWDANKSKHNEICDTLQPYWWGYNKEDDGKHLDSDEVLRRLSVAFAGNSNLLMNTGPLPDGSIRELDVDTLRKTGRSIRRNGWPTPSEPTEQKDADDQDGPPIA